MVKTKHLKSILELDQLYSVLISESHEYNWCIRDSEYDGRYIKGLTKDENKIRIVEEDEVFNIEYYYDQEEHGLEFEKIFQLVRSMQL